MKERLKWLTKKASGESGRGVLRKFCGAKSLSSEGLKRCRRNKDNCATVRKVEMRKGERGKIDQKKPIKTSREGKIKILKRGTQGKRGRRIDNDLVKNSTRGFPANGAISPK